MAQDIAGGLRNVLPGPLDSLMGPYASLAAACTAIPNVVTNVNGVPKNFREGKWVIIELNGKRSLYWWDQDYADAGLKALIDLSFLFPLIQIDTLQYVDKTKLVAGSSWANGTGAITANAAYKRTPLIQLEPNTQYTVSGVNVEFLGGLYNALGVRQNKLNEPTSAKLTELTFTTGASNNYLGLNISGVENTNPGAYDNTVIVSKGTNKTYYPYRGYVVDGSKISGDILGYVKTAQLDAVSTIVSSNSIAIDQITQLGVQLIDKTLLISGSSWSNVGNPIIINSSAYRRYPLIKLKPNTLYTVSGAKTVFFGGLYNSLGTVRASKLNEPVSQPLTTITFTTGSEGVGNYLGLNISSDEVANPGIADNTVMLAEGNVTTYQPYKGKVVKGDHIDGLIQGVDLPLLKTTVDTNKTNVDFLFQDYNTYYKFDGTAYYNLPASFTLDAIGDYLEIESSLTGSPPNNGLGLIGGPNNGATPWNKFGYFNATQVALRGSTGGSYIQWTVPGSINEMKKYRVEVVAGGWQLSIDGVVISTQAKIASLILTNLGSTYSPGNFIGNIKSLKLHNATSDLNITNLKTNGVNVQQITEKKPTTTGTDFSPCYVSYNNTGLSGQGLFTIYIKYSQNSKYYVGYQVAHIVDSTIRADLWRIYKADLYSYSSGIMINENKIIQTLGESEFVFQESGKTDATGGFHGDESLSLAYFYIDGVKLNTSEMTSGFSLRPCSVFHYEQVSTIIETDNTTIVNRCSHRKLTKFDDGGYTTKNSVTWLSVPNTISIWYSGISCIAYAQATEFHTENLIYYVNGSNQAKINETGSRFVYYNNQANKLAAIVESTVTKVKSGATDNTKLFDDGALLVGFDDGSNRVKYYREVLNKIPAIGDIWESVCKVKHLSNNY